MTRLAQRAGRERGHACPHIVVLAGAAICLALAACERAPEPRAQTTSARAVRADSGLWSNADAVAQWRAVVRAGHVREIHETVALYGAIQGTRRYE